MNNIKELREQTKVAETADEKLVFECALRMEISALEKLNSEQEHNEADVELKGNMTVNQEALLDWFMQQVQVVILFMTNSMSIMMF